MTKKKELKGQCGCGNVKYTIKDDPLFTQACHCKDCKISTGSSFVIHTMVLDKDLEVKDINFKKDEIISKITDVLNRINEIEIMVKNKLIITEKYNSYLNS